MTNEMNDIRWHQRFANYRKALGQLKKFIDKGSLNDLEEQGIIQAFEFTHELAWNVMKDYLTYQGIVNIVGSRDATREAFKANLVADGSGWMEMVRSRNFSSHTYDEAVARKIREEIVNGYYQLFVSFEAKMLTLVS